MFFILVILTLYIIYYILTTYTGIISILRLKSMNFPSFYVTLSEPIIHHALRTLKHNPNYPKMEPHLDEHTDGMIFRRTDKQTVGRTVGQTVQSRHVSRMRDTGTLNDW